MQEADLLSEEYNSRAKRLVGNFPQACSRVAVVKKHGLKIDQS
jgi:hypothetical protein